MSTEFTTSSSEIYFSDHLENDEGDPQALCIVAPTACRFKKIFVSANANVSGTMTIASAAGNICSGTLTISGSAAAPGNATTYAEDGGSYNAGNNVFASGEVCKVTVPVTSNCDYHLGVVLERTS